MAYLRNVGRTQRPQIATPGRMAAGTEDVSADVVLTEIKTRVGSGNFRVDAQAKDRAGRVVAEALTKHTNPRFKRSPLVTRQCPTRREDKKFLDVVEVPNPESSEGQGVELTRCPSPIAGAVRENNLKWGRTPPAERARGHSRRGHTARQT
jgi:hypothetical protein